MACVSHRVGIVGDISKIYRCMHEPDAPERSGVRGGFSLLQHQVDLLPTEPA